MPQLTFREYILHCPVDRKQQAAVKISVIFVVDITVMDYALVDPQPAVLPVRATKADAEVFVFQRIRLAPAREQI